MSDAQSYPYETRLNILFKPLEVIKEKAFADACVYRWYNQTLCEVNQSMVRLGVVEGEYYWQRHGAADEFFYVVEGRFLIELDDRTVELALGRASRSPMGVMHRPRAPERTVVLMV